MATRGCVTEATVVKHCIDQSDEGIVCCYSDKCNRLSTGHNRQARIGEKGEGGERGEGGRERGREVG